MLEAILKLAPYLKDVGSTLMLVGIGYWAAKVFYPQYARTQATERESIREAFKAQRDQFMAALDKERALNQTTQDRLLNMLEKRLS